MAGFIKLYRGWQDNPVLNTAERKVAWIWLLENAAWKAGRVRIKGKVVELERGDLSFSQRFMAEKWGWSKSKVDRFIAELRAESMIETRSKIGATAGHNAGQGQSIITICNYEKYQDRDNPERGNSDLKSGATAGQQRGKEEEGKEGKEDKNNSDFAFEGRVVRLNFSDFRNWQKAYPDLELRAQLTSRDAYLAAQPQAEQKRWFISTAAWLANKQQQATKANSDQGWGGTGLMSPC